MSEHALSPTHHSVVQNGWLSLCSCGWTNVANSHIRAKAAEQEHIFSAIAEYREEPKPDNVVSLVASGSPDENRKAADYFRSLADRIEKGEIGNIVVAFQDKENYVFERFGHWNDRWTMYGALEYAKAAIDHAD